MHNYRKFCNIYDSSFPDISPALIYSPTVLPALFPALFNNILNLTKYAFCLSYAFWVKMPNITPIDFPPSFLHGIDIVLKAPLVVSRVITVLRNSSSMQTPSLPSNFGRPVLFFARGRPGRRWHFYAVLGRLKTSSKPTILIQCAQISPPDFPRGFSVH